MTRPVALDNLIDCLKALRHEALTRSDIAEECGVSVDTAERWVSKLSEHGLIRPAGVRHNMRNGEFVGGQAPELFALSKEWGGQA